MAKETTVFKKVLVVDDTYVDRFIAERTMNKCGFASEIVLKDSAGDTLGYLEKCIKTPGEFPQLIFLDIRLPMTDTFRVLDEYEKFPLSVKNQCSIILMTALPFPDDEIKVRKYPSVKKIIQKPLDNEILISLMTQEH
jgi:CheY-like chemotaxis protein